MLNNSNENFHFLQKRQHLIDTLQSIVLKSTNGDEAKTSSILTERMKLTDFTCYEELVRAFSERCFHLPEVNSLSLSPIIAAVFAVRISTIFFYVFRTNMLTAKCLCLSTYASRRLQRKRPLTPWTLFAILVASTLASFKSHQI